MMKGSVAEMIVGNPVTGAQDMLSGFSLRTLRLCGEYKDLN
jgi:hypothetical protein